MVLHREDRQFEARHAPDFTRPKATRIDDVLGVYVAFVRDDRPSAIAIGVGIFDLGFLVNCCAELFSGFRVSMGDAIRIEVSVQRIIDRTDEF